MKPYSRRWSQYKSASTSRSIRARVLSDLGRCCSQGRVAPARTLGSCGGSARGDQKPRWASALKRGEPLPQRHRSDGAGSRHSGARCSGRRRGERPSGRSPPRRQGSLTWVVARRARRRARCLSSPSTRLEGALSDDVKLLALTIEERAMILAALEDPPAGLAELRAVLINEHQWRQSEGLDQWPQGGG